MKKIYSNFIIKNAKTWLNTKFCFFGRTKINNTNTGAIDCVGLILKVGEEINSTIQGKNIIFLDRKFYNKYPNKSEMKDFFDLYFIKIDKNELKAGDILYMNFDNKIEHCAIFNGKTIIHCDISSNKVVENTLTPYWKEKIICYYRYPRN